MFDDFDPLGRTSTVNGCDNAEMTSDPHHHHQQQQQEEERDDQFAEILGGSESKSTDDANVVCNTSIEASPELLGDSDVVECTPDDCQVVTETYFDEV